MQVEQVILYISNWLKTYTEKANTQGFVVGVSGGIDSAVTSTLCARTQLPVWCVTLPIHQDQAQVQRAKNHISWLQRTYKNVHDCNTNLTPVFEIFKTQLQNQAAKDPDLQALTLANTRARLRMTCLYYYAGIYKALVAGTGNKVEDFGVGFYTKYGDGGVDISPIADLLKSEVYTLAKHLQIIPEILNAAPTDGLFGDSRTDEDQLGATYDELEWAMQVLQQNTALEHLTTRQREVLRIYKKLNTANQHKMNPIPVCEIPQKLKHSV